MKKSHKLLISLIIFLSLIFSVSAFYVCDYYHTDTQAVSAFSSVYDDCTVTIIDGEYMVFTPENPEAGFIFYPGGKVEYTAYEPLMRACAEAGILCVLLKMPFNLAVFDVSAADGIQQTYPEIRNWYIGGHSLGGSMAAAYLSGNVKNFNGLVLLGSYSTADFSNSSLSVLSVYGSEDRVMNKEKYDEYKVNLPVDFTEKIIDGGNHAFFGMYGAQSGDGYAELTNIKQIELTCDIIDKFINKN